jgi:dTDP-4-amino-4,6-dideoxygalactose transaminase
MRALHAAWPAQGQAQFAQRVAKYAGLKALSSRAVYGGFVRWCESRGGTIDDVVQKTVRGFGAGDLFVKLRHQPSTALLKLLARRLEHCDGQRVAQRAALAGRLAEAIGNAVAVPGLRAPLHTHWVFTLMAERPDALVEALRVRGFDATRVATLAALPALAGRPELESREARTMLARLVYVPLYPEMRWESAERIAEVVRAVAGRAGAGRAVLIGATSAP